MLKNSEICTFFVQNELSKAKDELEAEKRELVRTLERRSQEMEQQSGKLINKHSLMNIYKINFHRLSRRFMFGLDSLFTYQNVVARFKSFL